LDDGLPGLGGFVGEDDDGDAVRLEDAVDFPESAGEHLLEEGFASHREIVSFGCLALRHPS